MKPLIQVQAVSQRFNTASGEFLALQNVSFDIVEGETISLIGHSGCGKSTLLNLIAGITTLAGFVLLAMALWKVLRREAAPECMAAWTMVSS